MNIRELKEYAKEVKDKVDRHIEKTRELGESYDNVMEEIRELEEVGEPERISLEVAQKICTVLEVENMGKAIKKIAKADLLEGIRGTASFTQEGNLFMDYP